MKNFIEELKRRNVIKASLAYLVIAWVLLQVATTLLDIIHSPEWVIQAFTGILILGLPIWIIISWIYEITPEGIEKTDEVSENELVTQVTNKRLNVFIIVSLSIAVIVMGLKLSNVFSSDSDKQYSIAVLYFDNMSSNKENEWLSDGFTEDILTNLSKIKGLTVIARTSVKKYKGSKITIPEIAKELDVDYIVEGSVRKYNNKVLITAQLINADNEHLWSENYEREFENIFAIQQNVAKQIANQLKIKISPKEEKFLNEIPTDNLEAYELFLKGRSFANGRALKGRYLAYGRSIKALETSLKFFQKAIELDPNYAEVYAEMANVLIFMPPDHKVFKNMGKVNKVNALLEKTLEIDPNNVRVYTTMAIMNSDYRNNWKIAKEYFEKAMELNSNDATAHHYYAIYLLRKPNADYLRALEHINIALKLDPYSYPIIDEKIIILLNNDKLIEAEKLYNEYNFFYNSIDPFKSELQLVFFGASSNKVALENKDWTAIISFYHRAIEKDPQNAYIHALLANAYNEILLDTINYIKFAEKAHVLDTTNGLFIRGTYNKSLMKAKKYEELFQIVKNSNWDRQINLYYYDLGDYKKSQFYIDKYSRNKSIDQAVVFAQQNKLAETYQVLNSGILSNFEKARVFAILEERDSMYYYIDKEIDIYNVLKFNGFNEVDPYRKEKRYRALLKKNYLPLTHWNE